MVEYYRNLGLLNSVHTKAMDTQLNHTIRLISGTIELTPSKWLPLLSNTPTSHLRRKSALNREWQKCKANQLLPRHNDCHDQILRLQSWNLWWKLLQQLVREGFDIERAWHQEWVTSNPDLFVSDPVQ